MLYYITLTCTLYTQACQKADKNYGIGDISTVSCDAGQSDPSQNKWIIKLLYTGGTDGHHSDFTFVYSPDDTTPEMTFDKEHPVLDYVSSSLFTSGGGTY